MSNTNANALDKIPKRKQPHAQKRIHEMCLSGTREQTLKAFDCFIEEYEAKWPQAVE